MPFILMTGHATIDTAIEAVRAGVVEFLEKPFDLAVFRGVVAHQDAASAFNLVRAERQLIQRALAATDGNRTHAARLLGIHARTLRKKLNQSDPPPKDT